MIHLISAAAPRAHVVNHARGRPAKHANQTSPAQQHPTTYPPNYIYTIDRRSRAPRI